MIMISHRNLVVHIIRPFIRMYMHLCTIMLYMSTLLIRVAAAEPAVPLTCCVTCIRIRDTGSMAPKGEIVISSIP